MRPVVLPLASGHRRVAARTSVKTCTRGATCNKKSKGKALFCTETAPEGDSAAAFCSFSPNSWPCACCMSFEPRLSAGRTITRLTGFTSRQEQQLDARCNRLNPGIAALDAEETQEEAQTEGWFSSLFFFFLRELKLKCLSGSQRNIQTRTPGSDELLPDQRSRGAAKCD